MDEFFFFRCVPLGLEQETLDGLNIDENVGGKRILKAAARQSNRWLEFLHEKCRTQSADGSSKAAGNVQQRFDVKKRKEKKRKKEKKTKKTTATEKSEDEKL